MTTQSSPQATSLIVGAGPVGLMMAVLLARQGLTSVVVERYKTRHGAPKAHALNPRTLEICRAIGLDIEAMTRRGTPVQDGAWVRFMTTLSGSEIGVLPYERQDEAVKAVTPTPLINLAQPLFEDFLIEMAARSPLIEVRRGVDWVSCRQDEGVVTSVLEDVETRERTEFASRYLIGADGAGSVVRRELGVPMVGDSEPQPFITIHFEANLRALVGERPGILYWIMQPPCTPTIPPSCRGKPSRQPFAWTSSTRSSAPRTPGSRSSTSCPGSWCRRWRRRTVSGRRSWWGTPPTASPRWAAWA